MGTGEGESSGPPGPQRPPLVTPRRRWSVPVPLRQPFSKVINTIKKLKEELQAARAITEMGAERII